MGKKIDRKFVSIFHHEEKILISHQNFYKECQKIVENSMIKTFPHHVVSPLILQLCELKINISNASLNMSANFLISVINFKYRIAIVHAGGLVAQQHRSSVLFSSIYIFSEQEFFNLKDLLTFIFNAAFYLKSLFVFGKHIQDQHKLLC